MRTLVLLYSRNHYSPNAFLVSSYPKNTVVKIIFIGLALLVLSGRLTGSLRDFGLPIDVPISGLVLTGLVGALVLRLIWSETWRRFRSPQTIVQTTTRTPFDFFMDWARDVVVNLIIVLFALRLLFQTLGQTDSFATFLIFILRIVDGILQELIRVLEGLQ